MTKPKPKPARRKARKKSSPVSRLLARERNLAKGAAYRWQPGQSGNPSGRPKTALLSQACRDKLAEIVPDDEHKRSYAQMIADMLAEKAVFGNLDAAAELADRAEGRPKTTLDVGERGDPLGELILEFNKQYDLAKEEGQQKPPEETVQ